MLVEVVLEADIRCPRCAALEPLLRRICDDLNIPFTVKYMGGRRSVAAYEESVASATFDPGWVERWGLQEHKAKLRRIAPVLEYMRRAGMQTFPNVIVRWHDGVRAKEIVIRGFDVDPGSERARAYLSNLYLLLKRLKEALR